MLQQSPHQKCRKMSWWLLPRQFLRRWVETSTSAAIYHQILVALKISMDPSSRKAPLFLGRYAPSYQRRRAELPNFSFQVFERDGRRYSRPLRSEIRQPLIPTENLPIAKIEGRQTSNRPTACSSRSRRSQ